MAIDRFGDRFEPPVRGGIRVTDDGRVESLDSEGNWKDTGLKPPPWSSWKTHREADSFMQELYDEWVCARGTAQEAILHEALAQIARFRSLYRLEVEERQKREDAT